MEGIFLGGSVVAAFLAGMVALFAPCCVLVVFPAYLAAGVRNSRWRLVPLTLVFAAGLAVVLVPVSLGLSVLSRALLGYHSLVYAAGGVLLLALAAVAITGKAWTLPFLRGAPDIQRTDSAGVFALGVFSGAASACCAPVLAGVLTLTTVSGSLLSGTTVALAYVFGMVFPLLVMTLLWDRSRLRERLTPRVREVEVAVAGRRFHTTNLNLVMAGVFATMGLALVVIGLTGESLAPSFQSGLGNWLESRLTPVVGWLDAVPDWLAGAALVAVGLGIAALSARARPPVTGSDGHPTDPQGASDDHTPACH